MPSATKQPGQGKANPHPSGEYGVTLGALDKLMVQVWAREVFQRAGCAVERLIEPMDVDQANALVRKTGWLTTHLGMMPDGAQFGLYLVGGRKPLISTVKLIARAVPLDAQGQRPFAGTELFFIDGPSGLPLWKVLEKNDAACKKLVRATTEHILSDNEPLRLQLTGKPLKSVLRGGLSVGLKISALRQTMMGMDGDGHLFTTPALRDMVQENYAHPVTEAFRHAVATNTLTVLDAWRRYFVTALALWELSESGDDSRHEADFILSGMLTGPVDTLFHGSGGDIVDYVMQSVMKRVEANKERFNSRYEAYRHLEKRLDVRGHD